jgi:hypothetical protein
MSDLKKENVAADGFLPLTIIQMSTQTQTACVAAGGLVELNVDG